MQYEITDKYGIGGSKMGESCHGPIMVLRRDLQCILPQAAEGIVKGR